MDDLALDVLYFGWPGFDKKLGSATAVFVPRVSSSLVDEGLVTMCAQDIFITFFEAVTGILKDVGGETGPRENNPTMDRRLDQTELGNWDGTFLLLNS